jgi:hypothetical protein
MMFSVQNNSHVYDFAEFNKSSNYCYYEFVAYSFTTLSTHQLEQSCAVEVVLHLNQQKVL